MTLTMFILRPDAFEIVVDIVNIIVILFRSLLGKEELAQEGCMIFSAILKYMGDLPSRSVICTNKYNANTKKNKILKYINIYKY